MHASTASLSSRPRPCTHRQLAAVGLVRNEARLHHGASHQLDRPLLPLYLLLQCREELCGRSRRHKVGLVQDAPAPGQLMLPRTQLCISAPAAALLSATSWRGCSWSLPFGRSGAGHATVRCSWRRRSGRSWRWLRWALHIPCCQASLRSRHGALDVPHKSLRSCPPGPRAGAAEHPGRLRNVQRLLTHRRKLFKRGVDNTGQHAPGFFPPCRSAKASTPRHDSVLPRPALLSFKLRHLQH